MADEQVYKFIFKEESQAGGGSSSSASTGDRSSPHPPVQRREPDGSSPALRPIRGGGVSPATGFANPRASNPAGKEKSPAGAIGSYVGQQAARLPVAGRAGAVAVREGALATRAVGPAVGEGLGVAAGVAAGALAVLATGAVALNRKFGSMADDLAKYSGKITAARAQQEALNIQQQQKRAQLFGERLSQAEKARGEAGRAWQNIADGVLNKLLDVFLPVLQFFQKMLERAEKWLIAAGILQDRTPGKPAPNPFDDFLGQIGINALPANW
jgi:hypothetical protein